MPVEKENIIQVSRASKRYSSNNVILRGLNMTVEKGTIYGLLGPSGCGKTTLLTCLIGYRGIDNGSITVHIDNRTQLGYMPQDVALMELFSVSEMLQYFGKVNGMMTKEIENQGKTLLHLMELDPAVFLKRTIGSLSGGQQRRISLTVALLHNPTLLILDEPTVGLDPLLSQKLWEFFSHITQEQEKTLIITTHYIEEARKADMIGLMRNGVLLAEQPPQTLLTEYGCATLEDVFLLLSQNQNIICIENEEIYTTNKNIKPPIQPGPLYDYSRIKAQIYKNVCFAKRNIPVMLFILVLPALLMFLFCIVYSDTLNGITIAVVTEEVLPDSCLRPENPEAVLPQCKPQSRISCHFLKLIQDRSYTIEEFQDYDSAYQALKHGRARALLHFNKNYSWSVIRRLSENIITPDRYVNSSIVDVNLDMAEVTIGSKIRKDIIDCFDDLSQFIFSECRWNIRGSETVLKFQKPVFGENPPKFTHSALGGFIIVFSFYITTFFSASSIISEKVSGFLERCLISGVRQTEVMFAHLVIQMIMLVGQNSMLLIIAYRVYRLPMNGSYTLSIIFILIAEIQGMFYGFFLGTFLDLERNVSYASIGTVICLFLSCGMFWPIEGAHWMIYSVLRNNPIVMAVESYRSITIRAWDLSNSSITNSMAANILFAALLLLLYVVACKIKK